MKRRSALHYLAFGTGAFATTQLATGCQTLAELALSYDHPKSMDDFDGFDDLSQAPGLQWFLPDEGATHARTWMAFGASRRIWGADLYEAVQDNLATIASTIAEYEPVTLVVRAEERAIAARKCSAQVELLVAPLDDLWMRDMGPVFVLDDRGALGAIDFNFNGWGEKQDYDRDAEIAAIVTEQTQAKRIVADIVLEGGGIEVDGQGTALMTESCIIHSNRNPGYTKADCEAILKPLLGLRKIIWLPGIRDRDITDGHIDFYARFAQPGVVVAAYDPDPESFDHDVTRTHLDILEQEADADDNPLDIVTLETPQTVRSEFDDADFAAGYINFYLANGVVIAPEFGDRVRDREASDTLQKLFPDRDIIQLNIDAIAAGGGGIHCTTQQQPATDS